MKKNMRGWTCRAVLCRRITPGYLVFRSLPGHSIISLRESVAKGGGFNSSPHGTVGRHDRQAYACDPQSLRSEKCDQLRTVRTIARPVSEKFRWAFDSPSF